MIIEFDGVFIESTPSVVPNIVACRIFTNHQPCVGLFNCGLDDFYKLHAMSLAMQDENKEFYDARFYTKELITYLDEAMGITVLKHED